MNLAMTNRLDQLTFTRCVAALSVVFFHFGKGIWPIDSVELGSILRAGPQFVTYFYVLSGFLMTTVHFDLELKNAVDYWISRFSRIYPVYLLGMIAYIAFDPNIKAIDLVLNVTLLQAWFPGHALSGNGVGWSLSVEMAFYACFPFLISVARQTTTWVWCALVIFIWLITQLGAGYYFDNFYTGYPSISHDLLFYFPLMHFSSFLVGMAAAVVLKRSPVQFEKRPAMVLLVASLVGIYLGLQHEAAIWRLTGLHLFGAVGLLSPAFAMLIFALCSINVPTLAAWPLRFLGQSSYAVYILQLPVMFWLAFGFHIVNKATLFWAYLAILLAISGCVFVAIETPARTVLRQALVRLNRRYFPKRRARGNLAD